MDTGSYDEENQQSRKRKEPDFKVCFINSIQILQLFSNVVIYYLI